MRVIFTRPRSGGPRNLLADAAVHMDPLRVERVDGKDRVEESPFCGLMLSGFSVWQGDGGGIFITFPSRAFGAGAQRSYFDYVRAIDYDEAGKAAVYRLKEWIASEYKDWAATAAVQGVPQSERARQIPRGDNEF